VLGAVFEVRNFFAYIEIVDKAHFSFSGFASVEAWHNIEMTHCRRSN
jgi:hypothetical protein